MYQLTCPSCKTPHKTPFVRMGAVAICGSCSHKYPVKTEYFTKLPPENPAAPEMVDRLLGIVPFTPGGTSMMSASAINASNSGVVMPNVPPPPVPSKSTIQNNPPKPAPAAAQANPPAPAPGAVRPAPQPASQAAPQQPAKPAAAAAAPAPAAPAQPASNPAASAPAAEAKPQESESTGFFGKLLKRFK